MFSTVSAPLPLPHLLPVGKVPATISFPELQSSPSPLYHGPCLPRFGVWGAVPTAWKCYGQLSLPASHLQTLRLGSLLPSLSLCLACHT